jgi:hypothetical protein
MATGIQESQNCQTVASWGPPFDPPFGFLGLECQVTRNRPQDLRSGRAEWSGIFASMDPRIISAFRDRAASIHRRWEELLRLGPISTPLGNPHTLLFLIPSSFDRIIMRLISRRGSGVRAPPQPLMSTPCVCGNNPYLPFYNAGERAMLEALIAVLDEVRCSAARNRAYADLHAAFWPLAKRDIEGFCETCKCRGAADGCRFGTRPLVRSKPTARSHVPFARGRMTGDQSR